MNYQPTKDHLYFLDGLLNITKFHRIDGPAIEWDFGGFDWWVNGKRHRLDGPAIDWPSYKVWYVNIIHF